MGRSRSHAQRFTHSAPRKQPAEARRNRIISPKPENPSPARHPPRRHGRLLRLGRKNTRPITQRKSSHRRRRHQRPISRLLGLLRSPQIRRPKRHADRKSAPPVPPRNLLARKPRSVCPVLRPRPQRPQPLHPDHPKNITRRLLPRPHRLPPPPRSPLCSRRQDQTLSPPRNRPPRLHRCRLK